MKRWFVESSLALGLVAVLVAQPCAAEQKGFAWQDLGDGRLQLLEDGKPALIYNYGPQLAAGAPEDRRRASYVYPLWTPGGVSMLDDFPSDHYHHRGLFWGWPVVVAGGRTFDLWKDLKGIESRFESMDRTVKGAASAVLEVRNAWHAPEAGGRLMQERVRLEIAAAPRNQRVVDLTVELTPLLGPVTLKGSQEPRKSYGGVSARFAPRVETRITADTGVVAKDEDLGSHTWAALEAVYPGGKKASLRIDSDASNPGGAAQQWCLRHYGFVGASYPGQAGITLQKGETLRLRYRVTVADGTIE